MFRKFISLRGKFFCDVLLFFVFFYKKSRRESEFNDQIKNNIQQWNEMTEKYKLCYYMKFDLRLCELTYNVCTEGFNLLSKILGRVINYYNTLIINSFT